MNLKKIDATLTAAEKSHERENGVVIALASRGEKAQALASQAESESGWAEEAARLLNKFSDQRQAEVIETIQQIASVGLTQIFDEPIDLTITQVIRARRVELDVKVKTGDLETSILDARGGGLAAVAGFLLRVCVLLLDPDKRRFMALDEVFAMLSEEYLDRTGQFIHELCQTADLQLILVSHQQEFSDHADTVYRIEKVSQNTSRFVKEK